MEVERRRIEPSIKSWLSSAAEVKSFSRRVFDLFGVEDNMIGGDSFVVGWWDYPGLESDYC